MELTVTRIDGSTYRLSDFFGGVTIMSAEQRMSLAKEDIISIKIEAPTKCNFQIGDTITYIGKKYKLNQLPTYNKVELTHSYDLTFEGVHYDLLAANFNLNIDTTSNELQDLRGDSLTGDLARFLTVLIANANRVFPGKWQAGYTGATADKTLTFSEEDNCLSVLNMLCDEYETEFWVEQILGVNILQLHELSYNVSGVFEFGHLKGICEMNRKNVNAENLCTRLYAFGTNENVPNRYRADRLCMPGKNKNDSYIESQTKINTYGLYEKRKYFEITPGRVGTITALGADIFSFRDAQMFDLNTKWQYLPADIEEYLAITNQEETTEVIQFYQDHLVGTYKFRISESPVIKFTSGNLCGYEFMVKSYEGDPSRTFTIVPTKEQDIEIPSAEYSAFRFEVGDTYVLSSINLPYFYLEAAEAELLSKAQSYYNDFSVPFVQYNINLDEHSTLFKNSNAESENMFIPGYKMHIKDSDYQVDRYIRIQEVKRDLLYPLTYEITTADVSYRDKKYRIARTIETQSQLNGVFGQQLTKTAQLTKSIPRFLPRIDRESKFLSEDPVLRTGEMCIVSTEFGQQTKIGTGVKYSETPFSTNNNYVVKDYSGAQIEIYNPITSTALLIRYVDTILEVVLKFDSRINAELGYLQIDGRTHRVMFTHNNDKGIYIEAQLSDREIDEQSSIRDIGTVEVLPGAFALIEYTWLRVEDKNLCLTKISKI